MASTSRSSRVCWLVKAVAVFVAVVVAMLAGEAAIRVGRLAPPVKAIWVSKADCAYQRSKNPILNFELKANYRNHKPDARKTYQFTNSHGQRDVERTIDKAPGVRRVVVLGDSVVEGHGLYKFEDTIPRQLEKQYADEKTQVLNFGVTGYCTLAQVELLETKALKFRPDVVVIVFVENDFDNFNLELFKLDSPYHRPALIKHLFVWSDLFRLLCLKANLFHFGTETDSAGDNRRVIGANNVVEGLRRLRDLADQHGFAPLIAIWPRFDDNAIVDMHFLPENKEELVIERLAKMQAVPAVRLSSFFREYRASLERPVSARMFYTIEADRMHPNPRGAKIAAMALKTIIDDLSAYQAEADRYGASNPERVVELLAVETAKKLGEKEPDNFHVYLDVARVLFKQRKFDEAIPNYEQAIGIRPDHPDSHNNLAVCLHAMGNFDEAVKHYRKALEMSPSFAAAHMNLADALQMQDKLDEAIEHYQLAIRFQPKLTAAYIGMGYTLRLNGQDTVAVELLQQALQLDPKSTDAHYQLALALRKTHQIKQAIRHFGFAIKHDPVHVEAMIELAWMLATCNDEDLRDPARAVNVAQRALARAQQQDPRRLDTLGVAYASAGQFENAINAAEKALRRFTASQALHKAEQVRGRLKLYRQGSAYVEPASMIATSSSVDEIRLNATTPSANPTVTFNNHVGSIIYEHCAPCHRPGEIAPFSLLSYEDVKKRARQIVDVTWSRYMPPWMPSAGDVAFVGERRLADRQIQLIRQWFDQGAMEGDAGDRPAQPVFASGWQLGDPDMVVRLDNPYTLAAEGRDVFRNFVLPVAVDGRRYVRSVELRPGNRRVVHHATIQVDRIGTARELDETSAGPGFGGMEMGGAESPGGHFLGWSLGRTPKHGAADMAWTLDGHSDIVLQLHMLPTGKPEAIAPQIGLFFADQPPKRKPFVLVLNANGIDIAAVEKDYVITDSITLPVDVQVLNIYPHCHYLGKDIRAFARLPDGSVRTLIHISDWDFFWQDQYRYAQPVQLPAGSVVTMRYTFDNSADNPRNPNRPPKRVVFGNESTDEMATLTLQVLPGRDDDLWALSEAQSRYVIDRDPEAAIAAQSHLNLGMALSAQGKLDDAITHLIRALQLRVDSAPVHYHLGSAYAMLGRLELAGRHFHQAVALKDDWPLAMNGLAYFLAAHPNPSQRQPGHAIELANRAAELTGYEDPDILETLADAYAANGDDRRAIATAQRALALPMDEKMAERLRTSLERYQQRSKAR